MNAAMIDLTGFPTIESARVAVKLVYAARGRVRVKFRVVQVRGGVTIIDDCYAQTTTEKMLDWYLTMEGEARRELGVEP